MELEQLMPATADLHINLPNGKYGWVDGTPTGIVFKMVSTDSQQHDTVSRAHAKARLARADEKPSIDQLSKEAAEKFASCIVGWTGLTKDGVDIPYSPEKAIELMMYPQLEFIREQVGGFATTRAHFFRPLAEATE